MVVGRISVSPRLITGNSSGNPPASRTPERTCSASSRKCALQGVACDQVLQIPITGRPSNWSCGMPWFFIHERCTRPSRSRRPNHLVERRTCLGLAVFLLMWIGQEGVDRENDCALRLCETPASQIRHSCGNTPLRNSHESGNPCCDRQVKMDP